MSADSTTVRRLLASLALVLGAAVLGACAQGGGAASADSLPLTPLDGGSTTNLATFEGTPTIVNMWASWCAPCLVEMPMLEQASQDLGDRVDVVGVSRGDRDELKKVADRTGVTYPLLVDDGRMTAALGITGMPVTLFYDASGELVERHDGVLDQSDLDAAVAALLDGEDPPG